MSGTANNGSHAGNFNAYTRMNEIGSGGSADVIKVRDTENNLLAMKIINNRFTNSVGATLSDEFGVKEDNFEKEIELMISLQNKCKDEVVSIVDHGTWMNGAPGFWYTMEYSNKSLDKEIRSADENSLIHILIQLLESLHKIHDTGKVIHLDIKPENILFVGGKWKFTDFGSAMTIGEIYNADEHTLRPQSITMEYAAPEQLNDGEINTKTDVWQMGIILLKILSGGKPVYGEGLSEESMRSTILKKGPSIPRGQYHELLKHVLTVNQDRFDEEEFALELTKISGQSFLGKDTNFRAMQGHRYYKEGLKKFDLDSKKADDNKKAYELFADAAEMGDPDAQFYCGLMLGEGIGVDEPNMSRSIEMYEKAAKNNHDPSIYNLGHMYGEGKGTVPINVEKAVEYYKMSYQNGNSDARYNLALIYDMVSPNRKSAFKLYRECAESGDVDAQNNLGLMYERGDGVQQDDDEAFKWYKRSSEGGCLNAKYNLAIMYLKMAVKDKSKENEYVFNAYTSMIDIAIKGDKDAIDALYWMYKYRKGNIKIQMKTVKHILNRAGKKV